MGVYYINFTSHGCDALADLEDETQTNLETYFKISEYGHRKKILKGIKAHFSGDKSVKSKVGQSEDTKAKVA